MLFVGDTVMTGVVYWEEATRFAMKLILESLIMLWTTIISTIWVVHFIRKQNKKVERRRSAVNKGRALSRELIKEISQGNIVEVDSDGKQKEDEVPLGYVLANQLGYSAFLQHCVEEINVENLLFLAHVCYFKKRFLDRIKDRQIQQNRKIKAMLKADKERKNKHRKSKVNDERKKMPTIVDNEDENEHNEENVEIVMENDNNDEDEMPEDEIIELQSITTDSKLTIKVDDVNEEMTSNEDLTSVGSTKMNETGTSFATIKTDVAVYDDDCNNEEIDEKLLNQQIDWSPSNCLAILTFRMCHNFERNHNRLTLIDEQDDDDLADYGYDENGKRRPLPLYVMATNLYKTFIKESGEYEINLPSKIKTKLHFFFHQNFKDLEESDLQYHEYRLFHIFDKSWAEIWHLLTLNSYRRFLDTEHYVSIKDQLEMALSDEKRSLLRLIVLDSNNDQHIATLIESHDPYKRRKINGKNTHRLNNISNLSTMNTLSPTTMDKERLNSMNIEEMNELNPTSLVNINVDPLPIAEQVHHFGKTMTRVKKAKV